MPYAFRRDGSDLMSAWEWTADAAATLRDSHGGRVIVTGDLNATAQKGSPYRNPRFTRMLEEGWLRSQPVGVGSYFSPKGAVNEIDHVLATSSCEIASARYVTQVDGFVLAAAAKDALSDHAALVFAIACSLE